jgi:hypothetical protein
MKTLTPLFLVVVASCGDASPPAPSVATSEVPAALAAAHDAYLAGDMLGMNRSLHAVLSGDPDPDVKANAIALLDAAYEHADGKLPADWSLPAGMRTLELGQVRVEEPNLTRFSVWLSAHIEASSEIVGLTLSRGGETLIDLATGGGKRKVEREKDGHTYFSLSTDEGTQPIGPGVYDVRVELRGEPPVVGWVLVSDITAKGAPHVYEPRSASLVSGNPTLSFEDFRSPAYRPFEQRTLWIGVSRAEGIEWGLWTDSLGFTSVVLGDDDRGTSKMTLPGGRHWLAVMFSEKRRFGPIRVTRAVSTQQPFDVR